MTSNEIWKSFPLKNGKFNGKSKHHWEQEAKRLVISALIQAAEVDTRSIVGALASARIQELAKQESLELLKQFVLNSGS